MKELQKIPFLEKFPETEYPTEYLTARLKGRKGRFITKWELIFETPESSAKLIKDESTKIKTKNIQDTFYDKEMFWLYSQMNKTLRRIFHPVFLYREITRVIACLRHKAIINEQQEANKAIKEILEYSLIHKAVKKKIIEESSILNLMQLLENSLVLESKEFSGLARYMKDNNLRIPEHEIFNGFFQSLKIKDPVIRQYFKMQIDEKNLISLYKKFRWNEKPEVFFNGGAISADAFSKAGLSEDEKDLEKIFSKIFISGRKRFSFDAIENIIISEILKVLRRMISRHTQTAFIVYYIVLLQVETVNTSLLLFSRKEDTDFLRKRLIV
ncbi:MAG: hypothetical protein OEZ13_12465 [Spirochaetia bacterium]|nr:hypothetical protein [Spirochaetia bacterium]